MRDDLWCHTHCSQVRGNDTKVDSVDDASDKPTKRSDQDPVDESPAVGAFLANNEESADEKNIDAVLDGGSVYRDVKSAVLPRLAVGDPCFVTAGHSLPRGRRMKLY